jgi:hypothetical protein
MEEGGHCVQRVYEELSKLGTYQKDNNKRAVFLTQQRLRALILKSFNERGKLFSAIIPVFDGNEFSLRRISMKSEMSSSIFYFSNQVITKPDGVMKEISKINETTIFEGEDEHTSWQETFRLFLPEEFCPHWCSQLYMFKAMQMIMSRIKKALKHRDVIIPLICSRKKKAKCNENKVCEFSSDSKCVDKKSIS